MVPEISGAFAAKPQTQIIKIPVFSPCWLKYIWPKDLYYENDEKSAGYRD